MRTTLLTLSVLLFSSLAVSFPATDVDQLDEAQLPPALRGPGRLLDISLAPRIPDKPGVPKARGPCPFLNTAANHGLLPYSGKGITIPHLQRLFYKVGLSKTMAYTVAMGGKAAATVMRKSPSDPLVVNLDQLNAVDFVHDIALVKMDSLNVPMRSEDFRPNVTLVDGLIDTAKRMSGHPEQGPHYITYASIAEWQKKRYAMEKTRHKPNFRWAKFFIGLGEGGFILHVFGQNGKLRTDIARSILLEETFPADWKPHVVSTLGYVGGITRSMVGYHMPSFVLNWFAKWEAPKEDKVVAVTDADNIKDEKDHEGIVQRVLNTFRWAHGDTAACTECKDAEGPYDSK